MIGYAECEWHLYTSQSLKAKRAVLKRALTRLKQKYNVSAAEIGFQDEWKHAKIAIVTVSSSKQAAERELSHALKFLDSYPDWERGETIYEWL
jgi:uncharacterized protein